MADKEQNDDINPKLLCLSGDSPSHIERINVVLKYSHMHRGKLYFMIEERFFIVNALAYPTRLIELGLEANFEKVLSRIEAKDNNGRILRIIPSMSDEISSCTDPLGGLFVESVDELAPGARTVITVSGIGAVPRMEWRRYNFLLYNYFTLFVPVKWLGSKVYTLEIFSGDSNNYSFFDTGEAPSDKARNVPKIQDSNFIHVTFFPGSQNYRETTVYVDVRPEISTVVLHFLEGYALLIGGIMFGFLIIHQIWDGSFSIQTVVTEFTALAVVGLTFVLVDFKTEFVMRNQIQVILAFMLLSVVLAISAKEIWPMIVSYLYSLFR
jgi:hypothetical protein